MKANLIQNEIVSKTLRPMLRTVVRRSAFQWGTDQSLRLSLDTNLHVINEDVSKVPLYFLLFLLIVTYVLLGVWVGKRLITTYSLIGGN